ncbi:hypothetical protein LCGC14_0387120 [marine sediment metagenome]|uniref:Uncharacterized protein n=1 Tax=marine sediment metagenome TaxID=412755 RepID=A0A0F9T6K2_9ZZZZ
MMIPDDVVKDIRYLGKFVAELQNADPRAKGVDEAFDAVDRLWDWLDSQQQMPQGDDLRERLADVQHEIWAHWMQYLCSTCYVYDDETCELPVNKVRRWRRQMETPYAELCEAEKESDREQADKVLAVLDLPQIPQSDWSDAPDWAEAHFFDCHGYGMWSDTEKLRVAREWPSGWESYPNVFFLIDFSDLQLPLGIDWRQTLECRPQEDT